MTKNEFDELDTDASDFSTPVEEEHPESMVSNAGRGEVYDYTKAPEFVKAPPRIDMNGKTLKLSKAEIILPPKTTPWLKTRSGLKDVKNCIFRLYYENGQQEILSGIRIFRAEPNSDMYSHPSITRDEQNQASKLLGAYSRYKKKNIAEVNLREFMNFLNTQPTVKIKTEEVVNPKTKETLKKNLISEFLA